MNRNYKDVLVEDLKEYKLNSRLHSDQQIKQVVNSINEFGFTNPLLIDENNEIIAGHCRLKAAISLGMTSVPCVVLSHLTSSQKKAYVIADNKLALNADWDISILQAEFESLKFDDFNLELTGFSLEELIDIFPHEEPEVFCDEDDCPDVPIEPTSKLGDVWVLGEHRLMCGDSTSIDVIDKLMQGNKADMVFTDPPYNTGMTAESQKGSGGLWKGTKGSKSGRLSNMFDDAYTDDEWQEFMSLFTTNYYMLLKPDSVAYICLDWRRNHELIPHIDKAGFKRSNLIVWDKMVHGLGSDYKYCHEFINVCKKGKPTLHTNQGGEKEYYDIWHIQRKMGTDKDHATKKPIELVERAINHSTIYDDLVVDLFGGSGSTLIACEKLKRKCFMMELDPKYCDVIIKRWENYTNKIATLEGA
jgi:DNA modification methylase